MKFLLLILHFVVLSISCISARSQFYIHGELVRPTAEEGAELAEVITNYQMYQTEGIFLEKLGDPDTFTLQFSFLDKELLLTPNELRSASYASSFGGKETQSDITTYKGILNSNTTSYCRLNIRDGIIWGYIWNEKEPLIIMPAYKLLKSEPRDRLLVFPVSSLKQDRSFFCESDIFNAPDIDNSFRKSGAPDCYLLEIATEADFEWFQLYGMNSNVEILEILNLVEGLYEAQFNIRFLVTFQHVWTDSLDPYAAAGSPSSVILSEIRSEWNNNRTDIPRDMMHMFSAKDHGSLLGSVNGGLPAICLSPDKAHGFTADRIDSWLTTAHEIGHHLNARHTDGENCGTPLASIMCSGPDKMHFFSAASINRISSYLALNDSCLFIQDDIVISDSIFDEVHNFVASNSILLSGLINENARVGMSSGDIILFQEGFHARSGSYLRAQIGEITCTDTFELSTKNSFDTLFTLESKEVENEDVFPNPFTNYLRIQIDLDTYDQLSCEIYDELGRLKWRSSGSGSGNSSQVDLSIDASGWPAGFYLLQIVSPGYSSSRLLLKLN